jgi:hypothetical protein
VTFARLCRRLGMRAGRATDPIGAEPDEGSG